MIIDARAAIKAFESLTALDILATQGYDPTTPKVKRAAKYLELWRTATLKKLLAEANAYGAAHGSPEVGWAYLRDLIQKELQK